MPASQARLTIETNEVQENESTKGLTRAPQPYHRRGPSLQRVHDSHDNGDEPPSSVALTPTPSLELRATYFDADHRKRRKIADTSSESGTEADDEKETFLLGLPAPSPKPHKGLKGTRGSGSPLLTPSFFDDEERRSTLEWQARKRASFQSQNAEDEAAKVREKFRRRRRAEIIRRATETTLFFAIGFVVVQDSIGLGRGALGQQVIPQNLDGSLSKLVLPPSTWCFFAILICLYALYPLRIILRNHVTNAAKHKSRLYIHLPAAFDPAPLLYPVVLPAFVAWSVNEHPSRMLLQNLALGISSMPSKTVPGGERNWYGSPQWILSVLPALSELHGAGGTADRRDLDKLLFLFPLHQSLLPALHYLTTTSLLVSELQLLSTTLINLLLLSQSPQAVILKAILWIGGCSLFVCCTKVLNLGVQIARIPSWRFRRPDHHSRQSFALFEAFRDCLDAIHPKRSLASRATDSSDDEVDVRTRTRPRQRTLQLSRIKTSDLGLGFDPISLQRVQTTPLPKQPADGSSQHVIMNGAPKDPMPLGLRHRSTTLPSSPGFLRKKHPGSNQTSAHCYQKLSMRTLTASQATVVRWLLAAYVYAVLIITVVFPIRRYVSIHALRQAEPVECAVEYLFGDLPSFHAVIEHLHLTPWITGFYPPKNTQAEDQGRAQMASAILGVANTRLLICLYCIGVIAVGLTIVFRLSPVADVDTRRKVFHGMMVVMFLPTIFVDPAFIALAFIIILAVFLLLDLLRASQLPPLAKPLTLFLAPYVDGRDHRGPVIVSHIFLLIGCAIPFWLSLASMPRVPATAWEGWEVPQRDLSMISGVICVGMGDAAASLFGRRYGRRRWCWLGGKSLEGSLAFALAVVLGLSMAKGWLIIGGWAHDNSDSVLLFLTKAMVAGTGASLTEAVLTGGNDNVIVPVILWLLVRGLRI